MYKVKVALDMASRDIAQLRPGMSARAVILTAEKKDVLRVPLQAVLDRDGLPGGGQAEGAALPRRPAPSFWSPRAARRRKGPSPLGIARHPVL